MSAKDHPSCASIDMLFGEKKYSYINGQGRPEFASIPYGRSTVGRAGCEAIACYNAMLLLGRPLSFEEVRAYFEKLFRRGLGWLAGGILGATPLEIHHFLKNQGIRFIRIRSVRGFKKKASAGKLPPGVLIVSYWNKPIIKCGFHTVAIDCRMLAGSSGQSSRTMAGGSGIGQQMTVYNFSNSSAGPEIITDLSRLMEGNWRFISGSYIPYPADQQSGMR